MEIVSAHWVGGVWEDAATRAETRPAPVGGTALPALCPADPAMADRALSRAHAAQSEAESVPVPQRAAVLRDLADRLVASAPSLADQLTLEVGCPAAQAEALQVHSAVGVLRAYADMVETLGFDTVRPGARGGAVRVLKRPVGVAVGIVPWNVPLFLACVKLGAAIAAGCPIVLKPSPENAGSMARFADLVAALDLPAGMTGVLIGDRAVGQALVADTRAAKVSFTGSTAAGRAVAAACAQRFARCTLELGGKSAAILMDDVDIEAVRDELFLAMLQNNGQVCGAQSRLFVPQSRYGELTDALTDLFAGLVTGDPRNRATHVGPVATPTQAGRIVAMMAAAEASGARRRAGGVAAADPDRCLVPPTLYDGVADAAPIAQEEVFGPVVVAFAYGDVDDAIARANASAYGLSGSVWGRDSDRVMQVAARLRTGSVGLSTKRILDFAAPFGGHRASGLGREMGPEGIDGYLETVSIIAPHGLKEGQAAAE